MGRLGKLQELGAPCAWHCAGTRWPGGPETLSGHQGQYLGGPALIWGGGCPQLWGPGDMFWCSTKTVFGASLWFKSSFNGTMNWAGKFICGVSVSSLYTRKGRVRLYGVGFHKCSANVTFPSVLSGRDTPQPTAQLSPSWIKIPVSVNNENSNCRGNRNTLAGDLPSSPASWLSVSSSV